MPATRRTSRPARKSAGGKRRGTTRTPAKAARREPLLSPGQGRDLLGLALCVVGLYAALVIYGGFDGASIGAGLRRSVELFVGRGVVALPVLLIGLGAVILLHVDTSRLGPLRLGLVCLFFGALFAASTSEMDAEVARRTGGLVGNGLHHAIGTVAGDIGVTLIMVFLLIGGVLLVTGASAGVLLRASARAAHESARVAVRATTEIIPARTRPAENRSAKAPETPLDGESAFATAFEPTPESVPTSEDDDTDPFGAVPFDPDAAPIARTTEAPAHDGEDDEEIDDPYTAVSPAPAEPRLTAHSSYRLPDASVLERGKGAALGDPDADRVSRTLIGALAEHGVEARPVGIVSGPRVTRHEIQLAPGTKVSKVTSLKDDLAYALATTDIRILAPIPGKQAVGVEVPNRSPNMVRLGDLVGDMPAGAGPLTVWLGKDISGQTVVCDLARMPHLLIAGTTGAGKSGCINAMLTSILLRATPDEVRMILVDPKKVELNHYETIPHLYTPVVTNMKNAAAALGNVVREMEARYEIMRHARARNLPELNRVRVREDKVPLPYLLVVIDELADLMMVSPAEVEDAVIRLAQKSRAVGIHLVLATQRPSVDVITGMIKANVPSRIAFAVSSQTDSRVILDISGAESLLGQGDMLYKPVGTSKLQRVQGAFITEDEIELVVGQCRHQVEQEFEEEFLETASDVEPEELDPDEDPMLEEAILCVAQHETASVSLLQRRLRVGYTRAGRLIDMLERRGVISGYEGSKPRKVLVTYDEARQLAGRDPAAS
jgi:S-DNA-T family DNA segregation ATPase FtsK/SpoIIIE